MLPGRNRGKLVDGAKATDCRALCVGPDGTVWAGINVAFPADPNRPGETIADRLHLVSYYPGDAKPADGTPAKRQIDGRSADAAPVDHGPIVISNPDYTQFVDKDGQPLHHHHGVERLKDGTLAPRVRDHGHLRRHRRPGLRDHALPVHAACPQAAAVRGLSPEA